MKSILRTTFLGVILLLVFWAIYWAVTKNKIPNITNPFPRCEERILPKDVEGATCPIPSKLMRAGDRWICSCRSESQTMDGLK